MGRRAANQTAITAGPGSAKTAEGRTVKHGVSRLLPYAPPWLMWAGVLIIAVTGWALWGGSPWYPVATWTAHLGALGVSRKMTMAKATGDVLVLLAMGSILGSGLLSVMIGVLGPTSVMLSLWGGIGFTLCMYWTIRRLHLTGDIKNVENAASGSVAKILESLNGAKVGNVIEHETGVIEIPIEVDRGRQSVDELTQPVRDIESVASLRPGAGKLVPSSEDAGLATMKFYPVDKLKGKQPWPGPSAFGESVALPIPVGRRMDYSTINLWLVADTQLSRNAPQFLVMGMNGAGKSEFFRMFAADLLTRKDVTLWVHDHVKGLQTLKPLLEGGGIDRVSMCVPDGKAMIAATRDVIRTRARWLGMHDHDQWQEGCGLNLLVLWLEEATDLGQLKDLIKLVREGRSVGVVVFISMQRATYAALDTDTRAQLSGNVCFGVESYADASFGLSDHIRDRGAQPELWKNNKPGYVYVEAPGIQDEEAALEGRTFIGEKPDLIDAIQRGNMVRRPLVEEADQVTIEACRKWYETCLPSEAYLPGHPDFEKAVGLAIPKETDDGLGSTGGTSAGSNSNVGSHPDNGVATDSGAKGLDDAPEDSDDQTEDEAEEEESEVKNSLGSPSPEYPAIPNVSLAALSKSVEDLTPDECRARVQLHLASLWKENVRELNAPLISKMTPPIRYKREWIRGELNRLCSGDADASGYRLTREDDDEAGMFRIVYPTG